MEFKRYVRDLVRNIIFDLENESDVKRFNSISRNATHIKNGQYKTADSIIELVQVGDMVDTDFGKVELIGKFDNHKWVVSVNETISLNEIKALWVKQDKNTFKRYDV